MGKSTTLKVRIVRRRRNRRERVLALVTLLTLVIATVIGFNRRQTDFTHYLGELVSSADRFEQIDFEKYRAIDDSAGLVVGYVAMKKANAFGGPLIVACGIDTSGLVINLSVVEHRETPSWYKKVTSSDLKYRLIGKKYNDPFELGNDMDGVTGATYTSRAIIESVRDASREIAVNELQMAAPYLVPSKLVFGLPEIALILLFMVAVLGIKRTSPKNKKRIRWTSLLFGMVVIGFIVNHPLTLVDINKFIMGYWPELHSQFYWYLLTFGIALIFLTTNKNIYCRYICPFGAAQDCLGLIGNANGFHSFRFQKSFKWIRRTVVWLAIFLALIFRNPGVTSYEVYSTLFSLTGTNFEVFLLSIVVIVAMFVKRPWCNFLCPVPAIEDYARLHRNLVKEQLAKFSKRNSDKAYEKGHP